MDLEEKAKLAAVNSYCRHRFAGENEYQSAAQAYLRAREILTHLRAPNWDEKIGNNGTRRTYRCPLGEILGLTGEYGSHSSNWPRTVRSMEAAEETRNHVLDYLESEFQRRSI